MSDYATRDELADAERRLAKDIRDTERQLRNEFTDAAKEIRHEMREGFVSVDAHLTDQDAAIRDSGTWPKYRIVGVSALLSLMTWLVLAALHVG